MDYVCGFDEAGRGPLAGPVTAACVILSQDFPVEKLNDSKALSAKKRNELEALIKEKSIAWAVSNVGPDIIDDINILRASLLAMEN
ncbi:MAG: ribonuclease HII, partial [Treponemataceae bacterium]|nr:ribonuclease HII [Treponemataceae bacterium]